MEGSSTTGKRHDDSSSSSGGGEHFNPSPTSSTTAYKRSHLGIAPLKPVGAVETVFRLLCPSDKAGSLIGKGGSNVRQIREETGARIRVEDPVLGSEERVVYISAEATHRGRRESGCVDEEEVSPVQRALLMVFERIIKVEEGEGVEAKGMSTCRMLAPSSHVVEKIRFESGAQIRIFSKEQVPLCALVGDELIQVSGSLSSVKKALLSVSFCLLDNIRTETTGKPCTGLLQGPSPRLSLDAYPQRGPLISPHGPNYHSRAYSSNSALDNGASGLWKTHDEENYELKHSPAQDAVIRIHSKITEACTEKGFVSARLLVPAQQIGCLLGKGGAIIAEMRRITGANIKIFVNEHVPKCAHPNDELVQVTGSFQSVQDALVHITSRIREAIFPPKHFPNIGMSQFSPAMPEVPPPFRPRNDTPQVRHPTVCIPHVVDPSVESPRQVSLTSPRLWTPQSGNPKGTPVGIGSTTQAVAAPGKTINIAVPREYMRFVHGEGDGNLTLIKEISGASITIYDPKPGVFEGTIVISGSEKQTTTAQGLVHAFILNGL
ncbi:hypothetical protein HPP92_016535 [Vanilla planifolia]|uniref:K Homology domain-containing protein n=1 Tax=Vanilla planifolia TaxID=51239 RepID=A0A835QLN3_VANPL|nr:hypothetical protein HPP92_016535 [Vanilla planifolia]